MAKPMSKNAQSPIGRIKIVKFYINSRNGQISIVLPRRKLKSLPVRGEFSYW